MEKTFTDFGLNVKVVGIHTGPVITQYEIALETGLRLNKVTTLADDLALNLKVPERAHRRPAAGPEHGRHRGAERASAQTVAAQGGDRGDGGQRRRSRKLKLPIFLGKDVEGRPLVYDLADDAAPAHRRPHRHRASPSA